MDSLLANYASSDEEEEQQQPTPPKTTTSFSSLPQPKSSLFQSLPQPKSSSSLFQSLPQPKSSSSSPFQSLPPPKKPSLATSSETANPKPKPQIPEPQPKRVVQFRPPIIPLPNPTQLLDDDDDDEDEERERRKKKSASSTQTSSAKSFLASIPAPRNSATLGVQASSGSGRRSIIETESPALETASNSGGSSSVSVDQSVGDYENYENYQYATDQYAGYYSNYGSGPEPEAGAAAYGTEQYGNYGEAYGDYGQYGNNWGEASAAPVTEASGVGDSVVKIPGRRGRHEVPTEIIEVKQDELIKNRPREDQVKLTGIAFGPTYQPASTKGKPSKLHKRKHQIGSLYFEMKQNEMKLAERRAKGMLTKAETQAKYGW
ncbi:proline-rich protein PRCC [Vigna unguiculata]|uniref:proline-rich protein PRCC n=1 Tax=Vigna unguiculata TaxID=3917 RepID=UPI001016B948|nr:proline-rich protein PRCC [Vigna unguiculata]